MKIYCLNCGKELKNYKTLSKQMDIEMKGNTYYYDGHEAVCPDCGEPLFVEEVLEYNKEQAWQAYRNANGIISHKDVLSIS